MMTDTLIIGPVSLDINIDCHGNERREIGGAVVAAGYAASRSGFDVAILTKSALPDDEVKKVFSDCDARIFHLSSPTSCSIENRYFDESKERRQCTSISVCSAITEAEIDGTIKDVSPEILHFAGLVWGDFDESLFEKFSERAMIAVDVQGVLRHVEADHSMAFHDWEKKKKYLPYIDFLKTDAAEAEVLTGLSDRKQAAELLHSWGAGEVIITHNTEVLVYDGIDFYTCPIKSRNLSGRTGRGDTTFSGYINSRLRMGIRDALLYATALVSLKMETPGPFKGCREDVEEYIKQFYPEVDG